LAQRSRKRGRHRRPAGPAQQAPPTATGQSGAAAGSPRATVTRPPLTPATPNRSARSEERNAAVRATLTPLAPGERPWPLKIAAVIALLIGAGDLIVVIVDGSFRIGGAHTAPGGVAVFSVLMLICAWGMWQLRYWAVLGFQAILVFVILIFSLLLLRANNVLAVVAGLVVVGGGGYLFYKLVRVLSRIQMPQRPGA
jgi:hypothetical protein